MAGSDPPTATPENAGRQVPIKRIATSGGARSSMDARHCARNPYTYAQCPRLRPWHFPGEGGYSRPKSAGSPLPNDRIWNGPCRVPPMPGEPGGMPGSAIPVIAGRSASRRVMAPSGTWPSIT